MPKTASPNLPATATPATQPSLIDHAIEQAIDQLEKQASQYAVALASGGLSELRRSMILARALDVLDKALTQPIMAQFMHLMNTDLGFKTDRSGEGNKPAYSDAIVKRCIISGLLQGVTPFFNQMNVIACRCYITQEGYAKKVRELAGLTDLQLMPGIPRRDGDSTVVRVGAKWRLDGQQQELMGPDGKPGRVFAIIAYQGSTPDNLVGKAKRKALKAIYDQVTGSVHSDYDPDEERPVTEADAAAAHPAAPPPAREPKANGDPKTGEQIAERVADRDAWLFSRSMIESGDLGRHVRTAIEASETEGGFGIPLEQLPASEWPFVKRLMDRFEAGLKARQEQPA